MKKVIEFRAKRVKDDKYIYGSLLQINGKKYIYPYCYGDLDDTDFGRSFEEVISESVEQFTGKLNSKGVEIYEN
jgi:hypothetical protein